LIVVDASVVASALADDGDDGDQARRRLQGERLYAPEILDLEVISVLRRLLGAGELDERRADLAFGDLRDLDLRRVSHRSLLARVWELRHTVTPYDAAYVALAEAIGAVLITADGRLASAPGSRCVIEVIT
jgi:predicted nucleic acid-binding protein